MKITRFLAAALVLATAIAADAAMFYYMPFDNGTTATLANYGSVGGTATLAGTSQPSASTVAKFGSHSESFPMYNSNHQGGAVLLPSSTDKLRMTSTSDRITFSSWVRWNGRGALDNGVVSTQGSGQTDGWALYILNSTQLQFKARRQDGNGVQSTATVPTIPTNGDWVHLAFTWVPGNAWSGGVTFYVNGSPYSGGWTGSGAAMPNSNPIRLGVGDGGNWGAINGRMDDTALWDTALSGAKIRSLYTAANFLGYDAGEMDTLFTVFDTQNTSGVKVNGLRWFYTNTLSGHSNGDTWGDVSYFNFVQFGSGTGVYSIPEPTSLAMLGLAALALLRRRR